MHCSTKIENVTLERRQKSVDVSMTEAFLICKVAFQIAPGFHESGVLVASPAGAALAQVSTRPAATARQNKSLPISP